MRTAMHIVGHESSTATPPANDVPGETLGAVDAILNQLAPVVALWVQQMIRESMAQLQPVPCAEPLLDKRTLAHQLNVSLATIDRLDRDGQPFIRVGDAKRYELTAVLDWHRARTAKDAPPSLPASQPDVDECEIRRVSTGGGKRAASPRSE